ncbi:MAG TPA: rhodanese-like domain-containing protein [Dehalococcoidia bacterium]|nr:rhodanese-like domain-containing protein [Dehalococcoidia bacterium]
MSFPIRDRGYPHPELLADTDWLANHLSDPTLRIVDAREDDDYASGHIPGAVHVGGFLLGGLRDGAEMPKPAAFAELIGALGIDESTPVVVYDAGRSQMAGMTAWAFLYYGHPDIRYLEGGLTQWTAEGRSVTRELPSHEPRTFAAQPAEGVLCRLDQAKASVDDDGAVFWDTRSLGEFDGNTAGWNPPPQLGHLPGAIHLEWTELFNGDGGTLLPAAELTTLLGAKGITPELVVHTY